MQGQWLLKALLLIGALIFSPAQSIASPYAQRHLTVGGQEALVIEPARPNGRLVMYIHGAGGTAQAITEDPVRPLTRKLLTNGYAVAASDAHGPQNWGNAASVQDYVRLAHRLHYSHILILAQSMGGLDGLQLIDRLQPEAWAGIYPVCNARSAYNRPELRPFVLEGWHGPPPEYLSPVKPRNVSGLRVLIWASPEDRVVPFNQNARTCARIMRRRGARVRLVRTHGDHGDPSNFHPEWLNRFFGAASAS